jgi:hypothetical protein
MSLTFLLNWHIPEGCRNMLIRAVLYHRQAAKKQYKNYDNL